MLNKEIDALDALSYHLVAMNKFMDIIKNEYPETTTEVICNHMNITEEEWFNYIKCIKPATLGFYIKLFLSVNYEFRADIVSRYSNIETNNGDKVDD
jgi:hypothetical protein